VGFSFFHFFSCHFLRRGRISTEGRILPDNRGILPLQNP